MPFVCVDISYTKSSIFIGFLFLFFFLYMFNDGNRMKKSFLHWFYYIIYIMMPEKFWFYYKKELKKKEKEECVHVFEKYMREKHS